MRPSAGPVSVVVPVFNETARLDAALEQLLEALSLAAVLVLLPAATGEDTRVVRLVAGGAPTSAVALVRPTIALLVLAFLATRLLMRCPLRKLFAT